jgi:purine-nucleoside phosphorylase
MDEYYSKVTKVTQSIADEIGEFRPRVGLITGTGLSDIVEKFEVVHQIPYGDIPGFPCFHGSKPQGTIGICPL